MATDQNSLDILARLLEAARRAGADSADALLFDATSLSVTQRLGASEKLERAESCDLGLRVFIGRQQAIVSSTDFGQIALDEIVERAVAMARAAPEDPHCGIADTDQIATAAPDLDICDPVEPDVEVLVEMARAAEDAARAVTGVTNSEGAEAGWSHADIALAATNGFSGTYAVSSHSVSASVLAGEGTDMESDYDFATAVHATDLKAAAEVGRSAGERAVRRLGARKTDTQQVPVVYDSRVSGRLVRSLTGAINGAAIARGTSFLKDSMDAQVFADGVTIVDDPHRLRGLRSKPFDGEGIATTKKTLIDNGRLTTWLLDLASARKLGLQSTGNASRGTGGPPSPGATNVYMKPGTVSRQAMIADIRSGFLVTSLMGMGVNMVTGDYSLGATGFWIENGEIAYPVSEVTVASKLQDMFMNLTPADDLEFRFGTDAPTIRVDGMTVAGA